MKALVPSVGWLLLLAVVAASPGAAQTRNPAVQVTSLSVERATDGATVRIKTSGPVKYQSSFITSPNRVVIDLPGATYAWNQTVVKSETAPVREVRGGQWKGSVARVVIELSSMAGHRIEEDANGLSIMLVPIGPVQAAAPMPAVDPAPAPAQIAQAGPAPAPSPALPSGPAAPPTAPPATGQPPMPGSQAPSDGRLISLDFKDADVLNLLRILAAESGRNIVAGEDVKGKASVSLHNVTWEQALAAILETRGLQRVDRNGIIRIVSIDQLTKEREAQARVQDAQTKSEIETRSKRAEAELRETEAANKRFQSQAKIADAQARGPLREEAFRLSYADPGDIANTLQGILAFGQQVTEIKPCRTVEKREGGTTKVTIGSGGGATSGPIAEPPFSQLFGPPKPPEQAAPPPPPVPEELVGKGLAIRTHCPTNTLFLRLYEADLDRIKKLVRENLDIPLPQVKIEARMEILDRSAFEGIGVQWGGAGAGNVGTTTLIGQGFQSAGGSSLPSIGGILLPDGTVANVSRVGPQFTPSNPALNLNQFFPVSAATGLPLGGNAVNLPFAALPGAAAAGAPAGGISFGIVSGSFNVNLALQALANQGKTRTLARPEIVMVENTIGTISLGEEIPYATVSSAGTQIQFKDAVLNLDVFPTVVKELIANKISNKIKMLVIVENNSRGDSIPLGVGVSVPIINKRRAETQVLIKEGDRLVIGGVTQNLASTTVRKVPLFGDIPVLGWLFKQKENSELGRELVIFVTPSLVTGQGGAGMAATPIAPK